MQELEGYQKLNLVYESAQSLVYRAFEEKNKRPVVLKILNKQYPTPEENLEFYREYELTGMFDNQGVIEVYEISKVNNCPAIIMEDINGQSLADILKSMKLLVDEFLTLAISISEIIGHIHHHNIIHKDITPSNIIWNIEKNIIRIIDFSIATELPREITSVNNPNVLEGTLAYISPEQTGRMNRSLDYRTDFYSLGVTFYWILTGRLPFESKDLLKLVHSHIAVLPVPPHEIDKIIPEAVSAIVIKLMAKNAEDRYLSAHGLKADLERCRQELRDTEAITTFELGLHDISEKFQIPQKLYGREEEIAMLMSAFDRVSEGNTELMLISGFSGIGKSMLVNEIQRPLVKYRGYFISGKFERLKKDVPYSGIIQAFSSLARQILAEDKAKIALWKEKILSVLGPNGKIITDILPLFELIIGKQPDVPLLGSAESQNRFNLVFQEFIRILASKEHPLVLFLDDLQWTDLGTLHLLVLFTIDRDIKHLFVIGTYRHNETPASHPLILMVEEIQEIGVSVNTISLQPLKESPVNRLLGDTLNRPMEETKPLAALLIRKTSGNPFFINEFLKSLYKESLIEFSFEDGWFWDITGIEEVRATTNVIGLMAMNIIDLPEPAQKVLKLGSCVGSSFNHATVITLCEQLPENILPALNEVLKEGMLNKIDDMYRFSHDRIQEAAYSLIPDEEKSLLHYRIGKLEFRNTKNEELREKIFYIVNQLNAGIDLVTEESEKQSLAELNLTAGKKALVSSAYASALNYLETGIGLLEENCWQQSYNFTLELHQKAIVAAKLTAKYETMEKLAEEIFQNTQTILDTIKVYEAKIFACTARYQPLEGIGIGLTALRLLGLRMPGEPSKLRIVYKLLLTRLSLMGKPVENLATLPEMKDPYKLAVMQILTGLGTSAYNAAPEMLLLGVVNTVRLSVKYGNSIYSPYSYAAFGMIYCGVFGNINAGYKYGELALNLVEKFNIKKTKSRVWCIVWSMVNHWKRPLRDSLQPLLEAYTAGLETGDLEFAALSINLYCLYLFNSGAELAGVEKEIAKYAETIRKLHQDTTLNYHLMLHQVILNVRGKSLDPCTLVGSSYDENEMLPLHKKTNDLIALFNFYYNLLYLNYFFENNKEALKNAEFAKFYTVKQVSHPIVPIINFYDSLVRLALFSTEQKPVQKEFLRTVRRNQKKMKKWALHAPENYRHKYLLVEAEIARVQGEKLKALDHYKSAAALAHENKFLREEALALELTAKFWLGLNEEKVAAAYMAEARNTYRMWGAKGKVKHLEEQYRLLLKSYSRETDPSSETITSASVIDTTGSSSSSESIDLSTVIKVSQTLSSETDLGRLLKEIMKFSIENAGAQKGFLILENEENKNLYIEAEGEADKEINEVETISIDSIDSIKNNTRLSSTIVHYVNRTGENIVLNNAHQEGDFTGDSYIIQNKIKSLLCAPITYKGKTSGILYLENNLTTNCFTDERIGLLRILSSQAAISIENARLLVHRENSARLGKEIEIAANIQTALLPLNPVINDYEITGYMNPADDVGGDYYDVINIGSRDWVVIGDVSGHGVPAGLIMMMVQTALHTVLAQHPDLPPSTLLTIINKVIKENNIRMNENKYITMTVFAAHEKGKFVFSGLHQDIMIFRADSNRVELCETQGMWIGLFDDIQERLTDDCLFLNPGDTMLVYTDGITEAWKKGSVKDQRDPKEDMFGDHRLKDIFDRFGNRPVEEIKDEILKELENYDCDDDVTMVLMKRNKA
ncbi:MAG: AAA family ATPase [bacterium]|nr:AAA family ATPase [bacterium]